MDSLEKIQQIALRLDHIEGAGEWLSRAMVHTDSSASQTGTLISVLVEDVRERVMELVTELEREVALAARISAH